MQSEIAPNLQEVQQEEEIICLDEGWQRHQMEDPDLGLAQEVIEGGDKGLGMTFAVDEDDE